MYFKNKSQKDDSVNSGVSNIRSVIKKIGLVFLAIFLAMVMFVVCKLYSIQSVISSNMDLISSVSTPLSAQKVLFDQTYTDADFKRDLKNFEVVNIHKPYHKSMNMYMILTNAQKYTDKVSTEEYQRLSEKNDTVGLNNLMKLRIHERTLAWSLMNMGANFMTVFFYDDVEKAYKQKYGEKSYFKYFIRRQALYYHNGEFAYDEKASQSKKEYNDQQAILTEELTRAYNNKDYATLRSFFEQYQYFLNFTGKIKHSEISPTRAEELSKVNNAITFSLVIAYLNIKHNFNHDKYIKDLVMVTV